MLRQIGRYLGNNVLGLLALLVALGGTAYAAATIGSAEIIDDSVKSVDIKNDGITSSDLQDDAVSSTDIRNGTVRAVDLLPVAWRYVAPSSADFNCAVAEPPVGEFCRDDDTGWHNYGGGYQTARFRKSAAGDVSLEGLVTETGPHAADFDGAAFVLPEGYRPSWALLLPVACGGASMDHAGVVEISPSGRVALRDEFSDCTTTNYVSLSGLTFHAG